MGAASRFDAESNLDADLVLGDFAILDTATYFTDLEPFNVAQRLCRSADGGFNGVADRFLGTANQIGPAVDNFVFHGRLRELARAWARPA